MEERHLIVDGTYEGLTWVVWARRDQPQKGDLFTMVRVTDQDGRILHVHGFGGRPLDGAQLLKVSTGGSEEGPRMLLARVHPSVKRLVLTTASGDTVTVPLHAHPSFREVRFAALPLPRDTDLDHLAGLGADGKELQRFSLRFQQGQWEARHPNVRASDR